MMKKLTVAIIAIALVALGTIFVFGQTAGTPEGKNFGKKHGMRGKHGARMMFHGLDLTDAQKQQMKSIFQAHRESTKSLRDQIRVNREQLQQLSENGNFNESEVEAIAQKQGALHAQMIVAGEKVKSQMFAILTPEQKAKAAEMKEKFKQKMQERKQKRAESEDVQE